MSRDDGNPVCQQCTCSSPSMQHIFPTKYQKREPCIACQMLVDRALSISFTTGEDRFVWAQFIAVDDVDEDRIQNLIRDTTKRYRVCLRHFPRSSFEKKSDGSFSRIVSNLMPIPQRPPAFLEIREPRRPWDADDDAMPVLDNEDAFVPPPRRAATPERKPVKSSTAVDHSTSATPTDDFKRIAIKTPRKDSDEINAADDRSKRRRLFKREEDIEPETTHPEVTVEGTHYSAYIVSTSAIIDFLRECPVCNSVTSIHMSTRGTILTAHVRCLACTYKKTFVSASRVFTEKREGREQFYDVDCDVVSATTAASIGYEKYRALCVALNSPHINKKSYYHTRTHYTWPASEALFIAEKEKAHQYIESMGGEVHLGGDAQFDTRGHCAIWGRYSLICVKTRLVLATVNISKYEAGGSTAIELLGMQKTLAMFKKEYPGIRIASLTTDRARAVSCYMALHEPNIRHHFDGWHFFRNHTMTLLKIGKAKYMAPVRVWFRSILNHLYHCVSSSNGDGVLAREKWMSLLYHVTDRHEWKDDARFTKFHRCTHGQQSDHIAYMDPTDNAYEKLTEFVMSPMTLTDIAKVSPRLETSSNEAFHALASRNIPKDHFYNRQGHDRRTNMTVLQWNRAQFEKLEGIRSVTKQKGYYCKTKKVNVSRTVLEPPSNTWRREIVEGAQKVRRSMASTPYHPKEPPVPVPPLVIQHPLASDENLEESEDEDEELLSQAQQTKQLFDEVEAELDATGTDEE